MKEKGLSLIYCNITPSLAPKVYQILESNAEEIGVKECDESKEGGKKK